jgi:hypothetical protein
MQCKVINLQEVFRRILAHSNVIKLGAKLLGAKFYDMDFKIGITLGELFGALSDKKLLPDHDTGQSISVNQILFITLATTI